MTVNERLADISKRCGMSEDIIRRVLKAEAESAAYSLARGEKATLIGRGTLEPVLKSKLQIGGTIRQTIKVNASVSSSLEAELAQYDGFIVDRENEQEELPAGVLLMQLPSLT